MTTDPSESVIVSGVWKVTPLSGFRMTITRGPAYGGTLLACGRSPRFAIRHPTDRKMRYYRQHLRRHERTCTACRKAKKARQTDG